MINSLLITGASGTLGRLLLEDLSNKDIAIYALSSNAKKIQDEFPHKNISFFTNEDFYANCIDFSKIDSVIHLAFARTQKGFDLAKSIDFTRDIFKKSCQAGVNKIIHISSQGVYGNKREIPSKESDQVDPFDFYSLAKYACEELGNEICAPFDTKIIHIRLASLLSPFLEERIVNKMISSALSKNEITIIGGKQIFSYLDTRDAINALSTIIFSQTKELDKVYNLGANSFYDIQEIAKKIQKAISEKTKEEIIINLQEQDIATKIKLDSYKFQKDFNWQTRYSLEDTIAWILENS